MFFPNKFTILKIRLVTEFYVSVKIRSFDQAANSTLNVPPTQKKERQEDKIERV